MPIDREDHRMQFISYHTVIMSNEEVHRARFLSHFLKQNSEHPIWAYELV